MWDWTVLPHDEITFQQEDNSQFKVLSICHSVCSCNGSEAVLTPRVTLCLWIYQRCARIIPRFCSQQGSGLPCAPHIYTLSGCRNGWEQTLWSSKPHFDRKGLWTIMRNNEGKRSEWVVGSGRALGSAVRWEPWGKKRWGHAVRPTNLHLALWMAIDFLSAHTADFASTVSTLSNCKKLKMKLLEVYLYNLVSKAFW